MPADTPHHNEECCGCLNHNVVTTVSYAQKGWDDDRLLRVCERVKRNNRVLNGATMSRTGTKRRRRLYGMRKRRRTRSVY